MISKKSVKKNIEKVMDTGFLLSIGIASIAKEKVETLVSELIKKGKLNENDGRKLVRSLLAKSRKERAKVKSFIKRRL